MTYKFREKEIEIGSTCLSKVLDSYQELMEYFYETIENMCTEELELMAKDVIKFNKGNCPWYVHDFLVIILAEIVTGKLEQGEQ